MLSRDPEWEEDKVNKRQRKKFYWRKVMRENFLSYHGLKAWKKESLELSLKLRKSFYDSLIHLEGIPYSTHGTEILKAAALKVLNDHIGEPPRIAICEISEPPYHSHLCEMRMAPVLTISVPRAWVEPV